MELRTVVALLTLGCLVVVAYDDDGIFAELDAFDIDDNCIEAATTLTQKVRDATQQQQAYTLMIVGSTKRNHPDVTPPKGSNSRCNPQNLRRVLLRLHQQGQQYELKSNEPNLENIESTDDFKIDDEKHRRSKEGKNKAERVRYHVEEEFLKRKQTDSAEAAAQHSDKRHHEVEDEPNCNYTNCTYTNRSFSNCTFSNCIFTNCNFTNCTFSDCTFTNCIFNYCTFTNCPFNFRTFTDCTFSNCNLANCSFNTCTFTTCNFNDCTFSNRSFVICTFTTCHFNNCSFTNCSFHNCTFTTCTFSKRSFTNCAFNMCTFTNCSLTNQIFTNTTFTRCIFTPPFPHA